MAQRKFIRKCKIELRQNEGDLSFDLWGSGGLDTAGRKGLYDARIAFEVSKIKQGVATSAHIRIFNLSREHREQLREQSQIKLFAGYEEDFINGTERMTPIFQGQVYHIDNQLYIDGETHLYCYTGLELAYHRLIFSISGNTTPKMCFREVRKLLNNANINIAMQSDEELKRIIANYNVKLTERGYAISDKFKDFFDGEVKKYYFAYKNKKYDVEWYFNDYLKKIIFYSYGAIDESATKAPIEIRRGLNVIAFDSSGREREFREKYFSERLDKPKNKQPRETLDDFNFYNVSIIMEQNIDLEKVAIVYGLNSEDDKQAFSVKSLKYIGDTHAPADEWKIDLELYEKRNTN